MHVAIAADNGTRLPNRTTAAAADRHITPQHNAHAASVPYVCERDAMYELAIYNRWRR